MWISMNIKKLYGYPYNAYWTDMYTRTRQIFIQRVRYESVIIRTLPIPVTSLLLIKFT